MENQGDDSGTDRAGERAASASNVEPPRYRKKGPVELAKRIVGEVWNHPNNRDARVVAVLRSLAWQVDKRLRPEPRIRPVYRSSRIWLDPTMGSASNLIYFGDRYDPEPMGFLEHLLRPGDRFVDIGANIGTYSILAAELVGPTGHVDAFEAAPSAADRLEANIALNDIGGIVTAHRQAVAAEVGTAFFRVDLDVSNRLAVSVDPEGRSVEVDLVPLDSAVEVPVAAIKIDVEGAEVQVLAGADGILRSDSPPCLLIEAFENQLERMGSSTAELRGKLEALGYRLARYSVSDRRLEGLAPDHELRGDVIAVPEARWDEVVELLATAA